MAQFAIVVKFLSPAVFRSGLSCFSRPFRFSSFQSARTARLLCARIASSPPALSVQFLLLRRLLRGKCQNRRHCFCSGRALLPLVLVCVGATCEESSQTRSMRRRGTKANFDIQLLSSG